MQRTLLLFVGVMLSFSLLASAEITAWRNRLVGQMYAVGINLQNPNAVYAQGTDGRLSVSYNRGMSWNVLGIPGLNLIRQIIIHPADTATIFCVAFTGGIRKSTDNGATWTTVLPDFGIDGESIALDPKRPDTMYAGNYRDGNVYRSSDRGETWTLQGTVGTALCGLSIRPDSAQILFAGTGGGRISRSTDEGVSWVLVKPPGSLEIPKIVIDPRTPLIAYGTGYAGSDTATGVWKTVDGGLHWELTSMRASLWALDIDPVHPDTLWTGTFSLAPANLFRSNDGGTSWDTLSSGLPFDANAWNLKIHPLNPSIVWLAVTSADTRRHGLYRWLSSSTSVEGTVVDDISGDTVQTGTATLLETGERIDLSQSRGQFAFYYFEGDSSTHPTLRVESYPYRVTEIPLEFLPDSQVVTNVLLQRLGTASISGTVLDSISHLPLQAHIELTARTPQGQFSYKDSTDGGGTFSFDSLFVSEPGIVDYETLTVEPDLPHPSTRFVLPPLGDTGMTVPVVLDTADVFIIQASEADDYSRLFTEALDSIGIRYAFWNQFTKGQAPFLRAREFRTGTMIYYTGRVNHPAGQAELDSLGNAHAAGANLFITGQNFVERNSSSFFVNTVLGVAHGGNLNPFALITGTPGDVLEGVSFSTLGGSGMNNQDSRDILFITGQNTLPVCGYGTQGAMGVAGVRIPDREGTGRAILFGFGFESIAAAAVRQEVLDRVVRYCATGVVTGTDFEGDILPANFTLGQNYPNPFNPVTIIPFSLPRTSEVTLKVFSTIGQEVRLLLSGRYSAGSYRVTFNGSGLGSGVYYYRLHADDGTSVRKCIILK